MLAQTIQCDFDEGTEDIINTIEKLLEFSIQPLKRAYMQSLFQPEVQPTVISPQPPAPPAPKSTYGLNISSSIPKRIHLRNPKRSRSTQK